MVLVINAFDCTYNNTIQGSRFYVTLVSFKRVSQSTGGLGPSQAIASSELNFSGFPKLVVHFQENLVPSPDSPTNPLKNEENIMGGSSRFTEVSCGRAGPAPSQAF